MTPLGTKTKATSDWYMVPARLVLSKIVIFEATRQPTNIRTIRHEITEDLFAIMEGIENDLYWSDEIL